MKKLLILFIAIIISVSISYGQWKEIGDTIVVQTLSYDSITTRSGTWNFPPAGSYEKILMHYSLKCDPRTTQDGHNCGEWDYLTYTVVTDSTGKFDSTLFKTPNFRVRGITPDKYYYTTTPYNYKEIEYISNTSYGSGFIDKSEVDVIPYTGASITLPIKDSKTFFIKLYITAEELDSYKQDFGEVDALKFSFLKQAKINNFRIKLKNSSTSESIKSMNEVNNLYINDITVAPNETKEFILLAAHKLETGKGITLLISGELEEGMLSLLSSDYSGENDANFYFGGQKYIKFSQGSYIDVPKEAFSDINKEITIAFWQYGDNVKMPQNSYAFEGLNSKNQRVVNSHLPWSNGQVYWDAGNDGGNYDRISKQANSPDFKGKWNHWAFTKNVNTGEMFIYLNGEVWLKGTNFKSGFDKIEKFRIASSALGNGNYDGSMDNFAVWNRELTANDIKSIMSLEYETNKQQSIWNGLALYYDMNSIFENLVVDKTNNSNNGTIHGFAESRNIGTDQLKIVDDYEQKARPSIQFLKANYSGNTNVNNTTQTVIREYPMPKDEVFIYDYDSPNIIVPSSEASIFSVPTTTLALYPANIPIYTYNENGSKIDSVIASATDSLVRNDIVYYSPVVDYEIHRFITPYGINLDLGPDGFTWVEDVTDFAPILQNSVTLSAGNQQELIDLKFLFVKGKPARDVKSVQVMWRKGGNFPDIVKNVAIPTIQLTPNKNATMYKALTRSSGHRFGGDANTDNCGEFCKRTHKLYVGDSEFAWEGWKECGDNPVFPQGGTWDIDRADWCPGASVNNHENELTGILKPGVEEYLDYEIINPSGFVPFGDYEFTGYLIGYGDPNFKNDATIERIISPTIEQEFGRLNPSCTGPEVMIRNNGSDELKSLDFEYGLTNGNKSKFTWTGNLKFLESKKITLPPVEMNNLNAGTKYEFEVRVMKPNNKKDEYQKNNYAKSDFIGVDVLSTDFNINLKTNNFANEQYQMTLKKANGDIVREVKLGSFESNKTYNFNDKLDNGCYELLFENTLGYGLDLWYRRAQLGTGSINITSGSSTVNFNPDFGNFIKYQFSVGAKPEILTFGDTLNFGKLDVGSTIEKSIIIRPGNEKGLTLKKIEMGSANFKGMKLVKPLDFSDEIYIPAGQYFEIIFSFEPKDDKPKSSNVVIKTDAQNKPDYSLTLIGNTEISSVEDSFDNNFEANIISTNNGSSLELWNKKSISDNIIVGLYNLDGKFIDLLWNSQISGNRVEIPINTNSLSTGVYLIKVQTSKFSKDLKFIYVK